VDDPEPPPTHKTYYTGRPREKKKRKRKNNWFANVELHLNNDRQIFINFIYIFKIAKIKPCLFKYSI
jgi:hypothetical protein